MRIIRWIQRIGMPRREFNENWTNEEIEEIRKLNFKFCIPIAGAVFNFVGDYDWYIYEKTIIESNKIVGTVWFVLQILIMASVITSLIVIPIQIWGK